VRIARSSLFFLGILSTESIHILVLLRAWAIWGCKRYVAILLIFAYTIYASAVTGLLIYFLALRRGGVYPFLYLAETGVCVLKPLPNKHHTSWILFSISLFLDFAVFFMVTVSLAKLFKETQCLGHPRSLLHTLAMDAALYLSASTVTSVIGILSQTLFTYNLLNDISLVCNPLVIVIGQRVVLNLRSMRSLSYSQQVADLNLAPDSSLLSGSVEDFRRVFDGDPLAQDSDHQDHKSASGIEIPTNRP